MSTLPNEIHKTQATYSGKVNHYKEHVGCLFLTALDLRPYGAVKIQGYCVYITKLVMFLDAAHNISTRLNDKIAFHGLLNIPRKRHPYVSQTVLSKVLFSVRTGPLNFLASRLFIQSLFRRTQIKHLSFATLAFVRGIHRRPASAAIVVYLVLWNISIEKIKQKHSFLTFLSQLISYNSRGINGINL